MRYATFGRDAARSALQTRLSAGYPLDGPCDVYELIVSLGLGLRFTNTSSLEGLYLVGSQNAGINVSSLRPAGLQRFTAAHELGHHIHKHGARIDDQLESLKGDSQEEIIANSFAWHLLMPKRAVLRGFAALGVNPAEPTADSVYQVATWLGVGYATLLNHLRWTLKIIGNGTLHRLQKIVPQQIKRRLHPSQIWSGRRELWPIVEHWAGSRLHVQVGDVVTGDFAPCPLLRMAGDKVYIAAQVGTAILCLPSGLGVIISVCRTDYVGLYKYRYLQEPEDA